MCGIVAVLGGPVRRSTPSSAEVLAPLDKACTRLGSVAVGDILAAVAAAEESNVLLYGRPGVQCMALHPELTAAVTARLDQLDAWVVEIEEFLERDVDGDHVEETNAALIQLRDVLWSLRRDRLRTGACVIALAGREANVSALNALTLVQMALSSLDRLEVRGRDSAGIHLFVTGHDLDLNDPTVVQLLSTRQSDPLFMSGSVRVAGDALSFVYKAAAEIGELGDNTRVLRTAMRNDTLLHLALAHADSKVAVLAHTRWASVGIVSEPNAHPLNSEELTELIGPYVVGALNGDVDNYADLKAEHKLAVHAPITTDAKVIPTLVSRYTVQTGDVVEAFRRAVSTFDGSVAIGAQSADDPDTLLLALRGSGQALYIGLAEDAYIVASEPYGLVEETRNFVRMDGETPAQADQPSSRGQVMALNAAFAGSVEGIRRLAYDATDLPMMAKEVTRAEVTTRDIDRGASPHFLLKEITEAPISFRKTLRGHIKEVDGRLVATLGEKTLPLPVIDKLNNGEFRYVYVIGQGTAAVAGQSMAVVLSSLLQGEDTNGKRNTVFVRAITATEFSGFGMAHDLSDTLIVAVSQSGTTTDTNRTVDLARGRGATVLAIVNRRNSDLTDKADGVLYTSDGRDVEMSVASTKAFYAQVAAGVLLACAIAEAMNAGEARDRHQILTALRQIPDALTEVLTLRPEIAKAAQAFAPYRRYWAVVGNGPNTVAAEEVRIKLSELCYKSIACDVTEDKKHIDLSCEPMILVCAAGLVGSTADDVAKEVAIYRAHKAAPIVVASAGEERFTAALQVISVPVVDTRLDFVLSAMVGHLFGYEAALAIDALARPLREAREAVELSITNTHSDDELLADLRGRLRPVNQRFQDGLRSGVYDGNLEASTAVRLISLLRDATSLNALDAYQETQGKVGTPDVLVDDLTTALTRAIEELTRPIDAIKHQAKTVTVGISRSDEGVLANRLVREVLTAGAGRDRVSYSAMKQIASLDAAVAEVTGYTRYAIEGDPASGNATIVIVDRGGISRNVPSRVEHNSELKGTKRRVAVDRRVGVALGRSDKRTVLLVPEIKGGQTTGLTLLQVRLHDRLAANVARGVLQGFDDRYSRLTDTVVETEPVFRDDILATVPVVDLLTVPIADLSERWRTS
jgi:glutamine---fructose-6-phosphate transaminase (isomerizing)